MNPTLHSLLESAPLALGVLVLGACAYGLGVGLQRLRDGAVRASPLPAARALRALDDVRATRVEATLDGWPAAAPITGGPALAWQIVVDHGRRAPRDRTPAPIDGLIWHEAWRDSAWASALTARAQGHAVHLDTTSAILAGPPSHRWRIGQGEPIPDALLRWSEEAGVPLRRLGVDLDARVRLWFVPVGATVTLVGLPHGDGEHRRFGGAHGAPLVVVTASIDEARDALAADLP